MATVYINPTFSVNGDGTTFTQAASSGAAGAFNAWGSGVWSSGAIDLTHFWKDATTYLQCEGTTYSTKVTVYNCIGITIGAYDSTTGAQIHDIIRCANVWISTAGTAIDLGTVGASRNTITVDSIDARNLDRTTKGTFNFGMKASAASNSTFIGVTARNCYFDGQAAVSMSGAVVMFDNCEWSGWDNGNTQQSTDMIVTNCRMRYAAIEPDNTHDYLTNDIRNSLTVDRIIITDNDFSDFPISVKQGIYIYAGDNVTANASTTPVVIARNKVSRRNTAIYCAVPGALVKNNVISEVQDLDKPNGDPAADPSGIRLFGTGHIVDGNFMYDSTWARMIGFVATTDGTNTVVNNTSLGLSRFLSDSYVGGTRTLVVKNNVAVRPKQTVQTDGAMLFVAQWASTVVAANNTFNYDQTDTAELFILNNATAKTWAEWIAGWDTTGLNTDPGLDAAGRPVDGSPSIAAGVHLGYSRDADGVQFWNPPSRGAYEYQRARAARTLPT